MNYKKWYVTSSFENWAGDSGWGEELFGPFDSLKAAETEAASHEFDCSAEKPVFPKSKHIVEIIYGSIADGESSPSGVAIERTSERLGD